MRMGTAMLLVVGCDDASFFNGMLIVRGPAAPRPRGRDHARDEIRRAASHVPLVTDHQPSPRPQSGTGCGRRRLLAAVSRPYGFGRGQHIIDSNPLLQTPGGRSRSQRSRGTFFNCKHSLPRPLPSLSFPFGSPSLPCLGFAAHRETTASDEDPRKQHAVRALGSCPRSDSAAPPPPVRPAGEAEESFATSAPDRGAPVRRLADGANRWTSTGSSEREEAEEALRHRGRRGAPGTHSEARLAARRHRPVYLFSVSFLVRLPMLLFPRTFCCFLFLSLLRERRSCICFLKRQVYRISCSVQRLQAN